MCERWLVEPLQLWSSWFLLTVPTAATINCLSSLQLRKQVKIIWTNSVIFIRHTSSCNNLVQIQCSYNWHKSRNEKQVAFTGQQQINDFFKLFIFQFDKKFVEELMNIKNIEEYPLDIPVNAELRSYQKEGINWMAFLNRYGLHGILCDDMGLGKTLQSICILAGTVHILRSVFVSILMTFL